MKRRDAAIKTRNIIEIEVNDKIWDVFDLLVKKGYEPREGQEDMTLDIGDALKDNENIVVEGGVGIGKSYAYLIPAILYNKALGKPIVIATSTIILQEQLLKDINTVFNLIDYHPELVLAKGQSHFLCEERVDKFFKRKINKEKYSDIYDWCIDTDTGDISEYKYEMDGFVRERINIKDCCYNRCESYRTCRYMRRRGRMESTSGIILTNQDLFVVDLNKKRKNSRAIFPDNIGLAIIDEAHNLEDKVRSSLKIQFDINSIKKLLSDSAKYLSSIDSHVYDDATKLVENFFEVLHNQLKEKIYDLDINKDLENKRFSIDTLNIKKNIFDLENITKNINVKVQLSDKPSNERELDRILEGLNNLLEFLNDLNRKESKSIFWIEVRNRCNNPKDIVLNSCEKSLDIVIRQMFFLNRFRTILTSATISSSASGELEDKYKYIIKNLGIPLGNTYLSDPKYSPYNYDENTMVYYNGDLPDPRTHREIYLDESVKEIKKLMDITDGRTLLLFTSKTDLEYIYDKLIHMNVPWNILVQDGKTSMKKILEDFEHDTNSILLGTGAFWEGISIEGEALTSVIILRLPFPIPDPIIEYKKSIVENSLMNVDVPEMIIKLKQGVGRLIRNSTDRGIISILDPRVSEENNKPYCKNIWESIPMKNRTSDLSSIKAFIDNNKVVELR
ncbi:MAG: ATP-dependent DNA helicase [Romboutsia sp.]|uniref:ATP-dependent DNA helicase n=1 Tax=Romboutsia sp. TaxID=1965302 RepID=UPI003F39EB0D